MAKSNAHFAAEVPTEAMAEVVRGIARDVIMPILIDRIVNRLESDRDFTAVFKRIASDRRSP